MLGLATRVLSGFITPLTDKLAEASARLLRKLALFLVAAICMVVVLIALTVAFDLWVASKAGAIAGALAVAGVYFLVAVVAVVFATRDPSRGVAARDAQQKGQGEERRQSAEEQAAEAGLDAHIDRFVAPLVGVLQQLGLRRERIAVLAGANVAKRLGPVPLVGLAIVGGFLLGRMWKSWRELLSTDLLATILGLAGLAGAEAPSEGESEEAREAAE